MVKEIPVLPHNRAVMLVSIACRYIGYICEMVKEIPVLPTTELSCWCLLLVGILATSVRW